MIQIDHLDHFVLTVRNFNTAIEFYTRVLGMQEVTFEDGRKALHFGSQKINLHNLSPEYKLTAAHPTYGAADLCFIVATPLEDVLEHLTAVGVMPETGIVERTGATGRIRSVYLRDPDGNLIELSNYAD